MGYIYITCSSSFKPGSDELPNHFLRLFTQTAQARYYEVLIMGYKYKLAPQILKEVQNSDEQLPHLYLCKTTLAASQKGSKFCIPFRRNYRYQTPPPHRPV